MVGDVAEGVDNALLVVPGEWDDLRRYLLEGLTDEDWAAARKGFGDPDMANE